MHGKEDSQTHYTNNHKDENKHDNLLQIASPPAPSQAGDDMLICITMLWPAVIVECFSVLMPYCMIMTYAWPIYIILYTGLGMTYHSTCMYMYLYAIPYHWSIWPSFSSNSHSHCHCIVWSVAISFHACCVKCQKELPVYFVMQPVALQLSLLLPINQIFATCVRTTCVLFQPVALQVLVCNQTFTEKLSEIHLHDTKWVWSGT